MTDFSELSRFCAKFQLDPDTGCWLWTASHNRGYGWHRAGGKSVRAARWGYQQMWGPIPAGLTIDHLCRNTLCVNPDHLEPVTTQENTRRREEARTHCKRGHLLSGDNLGVVASGRRVCKACRRLLDRRTSEPKTHCRNGHLLDEANTHVNDRGHKRCRACNREAAQRVRDARISV